jgi:acetyltransferase-like isoleucine patch superfamily enzyme
MKRDKVYIHSSAHISPDSKIGKGTKIWHEAQVREGASIGKNCILGKSVYVGKNVKIGDNVKLENRVSVFQGVTIENDVFVGPHVVFTNDLRPRSFNQDWEVIPTLVKQGASIGANSTILCGITIGEYAMIGAGSVVTKDVPPYALVYGNPAKVRGFVCRCGNRLALVREEEERVLMRCELCKTEYMIPIEDFREIED